MKVFFRFLVLFIVALCGGLVYSLTINILIMTNIVPTESLSSNMGQEMIQRAVFVWMGSVLVSLVSLFINSKWRYLFLALPVIAPSLYGILYGLSLN